MGIDPGTNFMGYAILRTTGKNSRPELVVSGVVDMKKLDDPYLKLQRVFQRTLQVIDSYHPDELAIESQFYGKNIQSMLKLGRAQGVAIAAALQRNIPIFEYAPKKIKMSITGIKRTDCHSVRQVYGYARHHFDTGRNGRYRHRLLPPYTGQPSDNRRFQMQRLGRFHQTESG